MTLRVLILVTHLVGIGHLTRAAAIGRAFARHGHAVTLVSGGVPAPLIETAGLDLRPLPPVRATPADFSTLLDETGRPVDADRLGARRAMLTAILRDTSPDVVITELFPFGRRGLAAEFLALADAALDQHPRPLLACSVRDILVPPDKPARVRETHERLHRYYDAVLVHGDADLVPLDASWPLDEQVRPLLHETGYVDADEGSEADTLTATVPTPGRIVVSGGGSAASLPLYRAAIQAAASLPPRPWQILVGGGIPAADFADLERDAPANVVVERARGDFRSLLRGASLSVSQAGYNTAVDLLRTGARAILVPFEQGRETEQRLRAERFAARGLAHLLPETGLSAAALEQMVERALDAPAPSLSPVSCDGANCTVQIVEDLVRERRASVAASSVGQADDAGFWADVNGRLDRIQDAGEVLDLWWRDDDATAATPALDRLLALAASAGCPLAIAVIPAKVEPSLARRLTDADDAVLLVHGLAHANHAPAGDKKAEFGPHRPLDRLLAEAREALDLARSRCGSRLLPVFVPPWNRIAAPLAARLPALGYLALSTFAARRAPSGSSPLRIDTHLDPVDWGGSRSLKTTGALVEALIPLLAPGSHGPIGLLTHHLMMDAALWGFCGRLLGRLAAHPAVRFRSLADLLEDTPFGARDDGGVRTRTGE